MQLKDIMKAKKCFLDRADTQLPAWPQQPDIFQHKNTNE